LERIKHIISFATVLFLGAVLLFGGAYGLQQQVDAVFLSGQYIVLCVFLYGVTVFAYTISYLGMVQNPEFGVYGILGGITLKMLISLSFFIFLMYRFPGENRMLLGLNFFCIYFLMSFFEVMILLRNLRRKIK